MLLGTFGARQCEGASAPGLRTADATVTERVGPTVDKADNDNGTTAARQAARQAARLTPPSRRGPRQARPVAVASDEPNIEPSLFLFAARVTSPAQPDGLYRFFPAKEVSGGVVTRRRRAERGHRRAGTAGTSGAPRGPGQPGCGVGRPGLEPGALRLKGAYSAIELAAPGAGSWDRPPAENPTDCTGRAPQPAGRPCDAGGRRLRWAAVPEHTALQPAEQPAVGAAQAVPAPAQADGIAAGPADPDLDGSADLDGLDGLDDVAALDAAEAELDDLDAALRRLEAGTYGRCERCGDDMLAEQLARRPLARLCPRHAA